LNAAHAVELKRSLVDFVLDGEGTMALALEAYSAAEQIRLGRSQYQGRLQDFVLDGFLIEGDVEGRTPIDWFVNVQPLDESDRVLLQSWQLGFVGLFSVVEVLPQTFRVMNWLTAKQYTVQAVALPQVDRLKPGEIVLTRIVPLSVSDWLIFSPLVLLGKLGKPKLAVAIGNFKQYHRKNLYGDAPELLAEAWLSVERQYQEFTDFFGNDEVTMPGYQLHQKLNALQEVLVQRQMQHQMQHMGDLPSVEAIADQLSGNEIEALQQVPQAPGKMAPAQIQLPEHLRKAESVTVINHPRWGQIFLPNYDRFQQQLRDGNGTEASKFARQYWNDPQIPAYIWYTLAHHYPTELETVLGLVVDRPSFDLERDLNSLLKAAGKPLEPELPEIASVPIHLNQLFQEALVEVNKTSQKSKPVTARGFQASPKKI
jgi:hypothetical protein